MGLTKRFIVLLLICIFSALAWSMESVDSEALDGDKIVLGWLQSIRLLPSRERLTAKLDSGAKSSALHAVDIEIIEKEGEEFVHFVVPKEVKGEVRKLHFERPLIRDSRVKRHGTEELDVRPVVEMEFCIHGRIYKAQFSLDNREKFNYPVLLGRRFLEGYFLVDPSQTFIRKYHCP